MKNKHPKLLIIFLTLASIFITIFFQKPSLKIKEIHLPNFSHPNEIAITFSEKIENSDVIANATILQLKNIEKSTNGKFLTLKSDEFLDGKNYEIQIKKSTTENGTRMKRDIKINFIFNERKIITINESGSLLEYSLNTKVTKNLTPKNLFVKQFNKESNSHLIGLLATQKGDEKNEKTIFDPYILNLKNNKLQKINSKEYFTNFVIPIPFENAILISRTKLEKIDRIPIVSNDPNHTELLKLELGNNKEKILLTGRNLAYKVNISPDGRLVAYIDDAGVYSRTNIAQVSTAIIATNIYEPIGFLPNGKGLAYIKINDSSFANMSNELVMQSNEGGEKSIFDGEEDNIDQPTFDYSGEKIALKYLIKTGPPDYTINFALALKTLIDENLKFLTSTGTVFNPQISKDGTQILYELFDEPKQNAETIAGFDDFDKSMKVAKIKIFDIEKGINIDTGLTGANTLWIGE